MTDADEIARLRKEVSHLRRAASVAEESLDQLLDDMGEHGKSVCQAAKDEAIRALAGVRQALARASTR